MEEDCLPKTLELLTDFNLIEIWFFQIILLFYKIKVSLVILDTFSELFQIFDLKVSRKL